MKGKTSCFFPVAVCAGRCGCRILNGLLGAGGGTAPCRFSGKSGLEEKHLVTPPLVAVILPLCVLSAGNLPVQRGRHPVDALPYLPWMLGGSLIGAWLLPKCRAMWLAPYISDC